MNSYREEHLFRNHILFYCQKEGYKWSDPSVDLNLMSLVDSNLAKADRTSGYHIETYKKGNVLYTVLSCRIAHDQLSDRGGGIGYHHAIVYTEEYEFSRVERELLLRYGDNPQVSIRNLYTRLYDRDPLDQLMILKELYLSSPPRVEAERHSKSEVRVAGTVVSANSNEMPINRILWKRVGAYLPIIVMLSISLAWLSYEIREWRSEMANQKLTVSKLLTRDSGLSELEKGMERLGAEQSKIRQELAIVSEALSSMGKRMREMEDGISGIQSNDQLLAAETRKDLDILRKTAQELRLEKDARASSAFVTGLKGLESQISELKKTNSKFEGRLSDIQTQLGRIHDGIENLSLKPGDSIKEYGSPKDKPSSLSSPPPTKEGR
jgi:hypothetical protein